MNDFYLRVVQVDNPPQVWRIGDEEAVLLGVASPETGAGAYFRRGDHKTIWHAIEAGASSWLRADDRTTWPFHKLDLPPKHHYPRMTRPLLMGTPVSPSAHLEAEVVATNIGQAKSLVRRLQTICQTVHPRIENFGVYGHEVRNLLILAATEVETHWRGVLMANGFAGERPNTRDYIELLRPMRLDQYSVGFRHFPWLAAVQPFAGWTADKPTQSLAWYDAYNSVKHNREREFERANLGGAFAAVSACAVMLAAQFTASIGLGGRSELSDFFTFVETPDWEPRESYVDFFDFTDLSGGRSALSWMSVRYPGIIASNEEIPKDGPTEIASGQS
jgi:hypothetical protein